MANFYGTARTNYVRVKNMEAAIADLEVFGNTVHRHSAPDAQDAIMISGNDDDGTINASGSDESDEDIELDWSHWCSTHLQKGQILVIVSAGAEKTRYISAYAEAYNSEGEGVFVDLMRALDQKIAEHLSVNGAKPQYAKPQYSEVL